MGGKDRKAVNCLYFWRPVGRLVKNVFVLGGKIALAIWRAWKRGSDVSKSNRKVPGSNLGRRRIPLLLLPSFPSSSSSSSFPSGFFLPSCLAVYLQGECDRIIMRRTKNFL